MKENHPNFESLRHLLALKRHEMPPPGYFNNFSRHVMARIRAGEAEASVSLAERWLGKTPWLQELLQSLETKPVFAGGFATVICMLLLFGAMIEQRPESASQAFLQPATQELASFASATPAALTQPVNQMLIADNSTNPVINFQSSSVTAAFDQIPLSAEFVTYSPSGN
jgi:hypothetical protein